MMNPIVLEALKRGLRKVESEGSGGYSAVGPRHPRYGRALGAYQVMEANIPGWSKSALGKPVSAQDFLNSPELQEKIVDHRLGGYLAKHGPAGAASKWFTGSATPKGRQDSLGTVDHDYVRKVLAAAQKAPAPTPTAPTGLLGNTDPDFLPQVGNTDPDFLPSPPPAYSAAGGLDSPREMSGVGPGQGVDGKPMPLSQAVSGAGLGQLGAGLLAAAQPKQGGLSPAWQAAMQPSDDVHRPEQVRIALSRMMGLL
jgi:hypothetical protein